MKKGYSPVILIFGLIITITAISLSFLLLGSLPNPKEAYCNLIIPLRHLHVKIPESCNYIKMEINPIQKRDAYLNKFVSGEEALLEFGARETKKLYLEIPPDSEVINASFNVGNNNRIINEFSDSSNSNPKFTEKQLLINKSPKQFYVNLSKNMNVEDFSMILESTKAKILVYMLGESFNNLNLESFSNNNFTLKVKHKTGMISERELSNYDSVIFINGYKGDLSPKEIDDIYKYYLANHSIALVGGANNSFSEAVNKISTKFGVHMSDKVKTADCIRKSNAQFTDSPLFKDIEALSFTDDASKMTYPSKIEPILKDEGNTLMAIKDKDGEARVLFDSNARHYGFRSSNKYCTSNDDNEFIINLAKWLVKDFRRANNISIYLLDYPDKEFSRETIDKEIIKLNTSKINDFLKSCTSNSCNINFSINSTPGRIRIDSLIVKYYLPTKNINVSIYNESFNIKELNKTHSNEVINFKRALNNRLNNPNLKCLGECKISINVSAENANLLLRELKVRYKYYDLKSDLIDKIIDCWNRGDKGHKKESFICEQFSIPKDYKFREPIDEEAITNVLMKRQWCHIIQNSDFGCGTEDNIKFDKPIKFRTNIMVRYDSKKKCVVIE